MTEDVFKYNAFGVQCTTCPASVLVLPIPFSSEKNSLQQYNICVRLGERHSGTEWPEIHSVVWRDPQFVSAADHPDLGIPP